MQIRSCKNPDKPTPLEKDHLPKINIAKSDSCQVREVKIEYPHPMIEEHHLKWVKVYRNEALVDRLNLRPADKPEAVFKIKLEPDDEFKVLVKCNQHGIWQVIKNF